MAVMPFAAASRPRRQQEQRHETVRLAAAVADQDVRLADEAPSWPPPTRTVTTRTTNMLRTEDEEGEEDEEDQEDEHAEEEHEGRGRTRG